MRALEIAATGMLAQQTSLDVLSNNIANSSTTGYKRQRVEFNDLMYQTQTRAGVNGGTDGSIVPTGVQLGLGTKVSSVYRINQQGSFTETENTFDLAINGDGYFQVQLPSGDIGYTRAGQFNTNQDGEVVTAQGFVVEPNIVIPQDAISVDINAEGEVFANLPNQPAPQNLGQIELTVFINEAGLEAIGNNLFLETEASGAPLNNFPGQENYGTLEQGFLESSNVDPVREITTLITAQRSFELNSRVISTVDEMLQAIGQIR